MTPGGVSVSRKRYGRDRRLTRPPSRDINASIEGGHMKKLAIVVMGAAFVVAFWSPAVAKVETVRGVLVDAACYNKDHANTANAHKGMSETCAAECAMKGLPTALVTADGKVYTVTGDLAAEKNAKLVPHMSHTIELTGDVSEANGKMTIVANQLKMISK
jgi:hypothetical protein